MTLILFILCFKNLSHGEGAGRAPRRKRCYFEFKIILKIKTKEEERKKKKEVVLKGFLLFSFLLVCWVVIIVYSKELFWSKFSRFYSLKVRILSNF